MSILARRALLAALTGIGLVLLVVGAWFTSHLGTSGTATFRAAPGTGVVVLGPSVLNRVDDPVRVTATTRDGARVWIGRTTPSDARAVVGGAAHTSITGTRVRSWSLDRSRSGTGTPGGDLGGADVWRQTVTGTGRATVEVDQGDAPEALVVTADGGRGTVTSVTVTIARGTWFAQALLTTLVGLILAAVGLVGLVGSLRRRAGAGSTGPTSDAEPDASSQHSTTTDPAPADPAPADPAPADSPTADPTSGEPTPADAARSDSTTDEAAASDSTPAEAAASDSPTPTPPRR